MLSIWLFFMMQVFEILIFGLNLTWIRWSKLFLTSFLLLSGKIQGKRRWYFDICFFFLLFFLIMFLQPSVLFNLVWCRKVLTQGKTSFTDNTVSSLHHHKQNWIFALRKSLQLEKKKWYLWLSCDFFPLKYFLKACLVKSWYLISSRWCWKKLKDFLFFVLQYRISCARLLMHWQHCLLWHFLIISDYWQLFASIPHQKIFLYRCN